MSEGQRAAEQTKSTFHQLSDATEGLRNNINSYADNLLGGNKSHQSTGVHPDAKKAGDEAAKGFGAAAGKAESFVNSHKK